MIIMPGRKNSMSMKGVKTMSTHSRNRILYAILCCGGIAMTAALTNDTPSFAQEEDAVVRELEKSIAGKEQEPAEKVFKNIKIMRGIPAGRVLRIMERGFAPALGVGCEYCHVEGKWASDSLDTKQVARKMWTMVGTINKDLKTIRADATVNCTTCHRGAPKPEAKR